jgi:hypothetical protein
MAHLKKFRVHVRNRAAARRCWGVRVMRTSGALLRTSAALLRNTVLRAAFPRHVWGVRACASLRACKYATLLSEA